MVLFERRRWMIWVGMAVAVGVVVGVVEHSRWHLASPKNVAASHPLTRAMPPATTQSVATAAPPAKTLLDVIRRDHPDYPTTQPLPAYEAQSFDDCGHFVLRDPVYLDGAANLWITHPDAEDATTVLKRAQEETTHVLRQRILFVHRISNADGSMRTIAICPDAQDQGLVAIDAEGKMALKRQAGEYDWASAFSWKNQVVVPTRQGATVLSFENGVVETVSPPLAPAEGPHEKVEMVQDIDEVFAWIPPGPTTPGSHGAVRFDGKSWSVWGPRQNWPDAIVELVPLSDGSVLQLVKDDSPDMEQGGSANPELAGDIPEESPAARGIKVKPHLVLLAASHVDEAKAVALIRDLSANAPERRRAAYAELTNFGIGIWPILERELPNADGVEARQSIQRLLRTKIAPTLGGMSLVDGHLRCLVRQPSGIALYYVDGGVSCPQGEGEDRVVVPAYLSHPALQPTSDWPGALYGTLSEGVAQKIHPDKFTFAVVGNEWIFGDPTTGPMRYSGNSFIPMLPRSQCEFCQVVGADAVGRWLFRKPVSRATASTQAATRGESQAVETLIVDPRLPDATPRLPVWAVVMGQAQTGWSADGWPALKNTGVWTLRETQWQTMDMDKEKMLTDERQAATMPATTMSAGAMSATSLPADATAGPAILVDAQGRTYYGGQSSLVVVDRQGRRVDWPLPERTVGSGEVRLIQTKDERLFLFNQPGRVVRIVPTPLKSEPFSVEAVFSQHLPEAQHPRRIWLDPAGRIDIVYDDDGLSILFPTGHIPDDIERMMPVSADEEDEP